MCTCVHLYAYVCMHLHVCVHWSRDGGSKFNLGVHILHPDAIYLSQNPSIMVTSSDTQIVFGLLSQNMSHCEPGTPK